MGPTPGPTDAGMISLLSYVVPVVAILIVLIAMPPVRKAMSGRVNGTREYFYGPPISQTHDPEEETSGGDLPVDTPEWLSMDLYNEADPQQDGELDLPADEPADDVPSNEGTNAGDDDPSSPAPREPTDPFERLYG